MFVGGLTDVTSSVDSAVAVVAASCDIAGSGPGS